MLASLIHTNRQGEIEKFEDGAIDISSDEDGQGNAKRPRFRQITLSSHWRPVQQRTDSSSLETRPPHATLVVCPVSLAKQWQEELERMSVKNTLRSMLWYGNERGDLETLLDPSSVTTVDVVITTYGTLSSEHLKWVKAKAKPSYEGGGLFDGVSVNADAGGPETRD